MCSNGSDMKELYTQVSELFSERCDQTFEKICSIESGESEKIIETYLECRREYNDRKRVIDHVLNYLNNSWVYKSINTGVPDVYKVRVKADVIWRSSMFSHEVHKRLTLAILDLIVADREGDAINDSAIKDCINDFCKFMLTFILNIFSMLQISLDSTPRLKTRSRPRSTPTTLKLSSSK